MDAKIEDALNDIFSYHPPSSGDEAVYNKLRYGALSFARVVMEECPPCADRMAALRKIREAVMTANASVALKGRDIPREGAPQVDGGGPQRGRPLSEVLRDAAPGALEKANAGEPERVYDLDETPVPEKK